eukprot:Platyproteum_vivax@DN957_c0_g1_i2.p1
MCDMAPNKCSMPPLKEKLMSFCFRRPTVKRLFVTQMYKSSDLEEQCLRGLGHYPLGVLRQLPDWELLAQETELQILERRVLLLQSCLPHIPSHLTGRVTTQ